VKLDGAKRSKLKEILQKRSNAGKYLHAQQTPSVENNGSIFHVVRTAESHGDVHRWNQMPKSLPENAKTTNTTAVFNDGRTIFTEVLLGENPLLAVGLPSLPSRVELVKNRDMAQVTFY